MLIEIMKNICKSNVNGTHSKEREVMIDTSRVHPIINDSYDEPKRSKGNKKVQWVEVEMTSIIYPSVNPEISDIDDDGYYVYNININFPEWSK